MRTRNLGTNVCDTSVTPCHHLRSAPWCRPSSHSPLAYVWGAPWACYAAVAMWKKAEHVCHAGTDIAHTCIHASAGTMIHRDSQEGFTHAWTCTCTRSAWRGWWHVLHTSPLVWSWIRRLSARVNWGGSSGSGVGGRLRLLFIASQGKRLKSVGRLLRLKFKLR